MEVTMEGTGTGSVASDDSEEALLAELYSWTEGLPADHLSTWLANLAASGSMPGLQANLSLLEQQARTAAASGGPLAPGGRQHTTKHQAALQSQSAMRVARSGPQASMQQQAAPVDAAALQMQLQQTERCLADEGTKPNLDELLQTFIKEEMSGIQGPQQQQPPTLRPLKQPKQRQAPVSQQQQQQQQAEEQKQRLDPWPNQQQQLAGALPFLPMGAGQQQAHGGGGPAAADPLGAAAYSSGGSSLTEPAAGPAVWPPPPAVAAAGHPAAAAGAQLGPAFVPGAGPRGPCAPEEGHKLAGLTSTVGGLTAAARASVGSEAAEDKVARRKAAMKRAYARFQERKRDEAVQLERTLRDKLAQVETLLVENRTLRSKQDIMEAWLRSHLVQVEALQELLSKMQLEPRANAGGGAGTSSRSASISSGRGSQGSSSSRGDSSGHGSGIREGGPGGQSTVGSSRDMLNGSETGRDYGTTTCVDVAAAALLGAAPDQGDGASGTSGSQLSRRTRVDNSASASYPSLPVGGAMQAEVSEAALTGGQVSSASEAALAHAPTKAITAVIRADAATGADEEAWVTAAAAAAEGDLSAEQQELLRERLRDNSFTGEVPDAVLSEAYAAAAAAQGRAEELLRRFNMCMEMTGWPDRTLNPQLTREAAEAGIAGGLAPEMFQLAPGALQQAARFIQELSRDPPDPATISTTGLRLLYARWTAAAAPLAPHASPQLPGHDHKAEQLMGMLAKMIFKLFHGMGVIRPFEMEAFRSGNCVSGKRGEMPLSRYKTMTELVPAREASMQNVVTCMLLFMDGMSKILTARVELLQQLHQALQETSGRGVCEVGIAGPSSGLPLEPVEVLEGLAQKLQDNLKQQVTMVRQMQGASFFLRPPAVAGQGLTLSWPYLPLAFKTVQVATGIQLPPLFCQAGMGLSANELPAPRYGVDPQGQWVRKRS